MRRTDLAKALVNAANAAARRRLLAANPGIADERLAGEIRKVCYAAWTSKPTEAQRAWLAIKALSAVTESDEIRANADWVSGISNITKGKFDDAVDDLECASQRFTALGREAESAQTLVPKLLALAITGRYDEAVKTGRHALRIFVATGDDLAAGKIELNLSNIAARRSRLRDAEKHGVSALTLFTSAGEATWQAMAENDLANTYMELNDFSAAGRFYQLALATARSAKMIVTEAEIEASMGNLATIRGDYADALRSLELSRRKYEMLAMPHQTAIADLEMADIYATLNLNAEAFSIYRSVADGFRRLKMRSEEARSRLNLGRAAAKTGEPATARREFERAAKLYSAEKDNAGSISVLLARARLEFDLGRYTKVTEMIGSSRPAIAATQNVRQSLAADLIEGESLRMTGQNEHAEAVFQRAYTAATDSEQANFARSAINSLAHTAAAAGDAKLAETRFKTAIRLTEAMRAPLAAEEFSMAFLADKLDAYDGLTRLYIRQGKFEQAFALTESSRSRSLLDSMSAVAMSDTVADDLTAKLRDLRTELNWFYKRLDDTDDRPKTEKEIARREREVAEITRRIGSVASGRAGKANVESFDLRRLKRKLGDERTLIEYVEFDGRVSAFVVGRDRLGYVADICRMADVADDLEDLQFQFGTCRFGLANLGKFKDEMKRRADACLGRLHSRLISPLMHLLNGSEIVIVPSGLLNYVPFPALFDGERYLVELFTVSHAPGAAIWSALQERDRPPIVKALLVGFADEQIPLVEKEIDALKKQFAGSTILKGKKATFAAFSEFAAEYDLIHLACHGQFRSDNPMFSSLHLADGWITVRDIFSQRLRASVVTLSACETGLSKVFAGNEILGLVRGFLTAGASSLIVSLWTVNDAATAPLMADLYAAMQRGEAPAASLRKAQLEFIARGDHPYLWSPFVSIGK